MNSNLQDTVKQLEQAISDLEKQRETLDAATVEAAISSMRQKLAELESQPVSHPQQRKLATILYADVVGSTNLSQHLEPDEVLEIMDRALKRLAEPVEAHGGHVTRFQGDGFKAVFGLPVAHENDPEQAVRAGLEILKVAQEIASEWYEQLGIPNFQVRVGINTGMVAAGGETEAEDTVMGRAVNLAARLESAAPPGGLLISHHTYRHVRGVFDVEPQGPIQTKGFDRPVEVYLVRSAKPRAFHVLTRGVEGVETRMVGRETELKYLQDALLTAIEEGEGQVVTVVGEAGVGKSRLIYEFQNWFELLPQVVRLFAGQAKLETQHIPYSLLRDLFAYRFQIQDSDLLQVVHHKFEQGIMPAFKSQPIPLKQDELPDQAQVHLLGQLLGFGFNHSPHLKGFLQDSEALRNRGQLALEAYFSALSKSGTMVLFLEDLHWADESSLDAIRRLGKMTPNLPLLIVCLARDQLYELRPYWGEGEEFHTRLDLRPLSKRESRQLVEEILQYIDQVPLELRELVVSGAEGNPFYLEELLKMLIEKGVILTGEFDPQGVERWRVATEKLAQIDLPTTLTGVLQARLDSLAAPEKKLLQQAAVVGRTFWDQLLAHLFRQVNGNQGGRELAEILKVLRGKELIYRHEESAISGAVEYTFKHDLLREVVYETVLVKERKGYHGLVADWLLQKSDERLGEFYGLIGEHLEGAGRKEQASETFYLAGDQALNRYANKEAEGYFRRALALKPRNHVRAKLNSGLGKALALQGHLKEAIKCLKEGISIYHLLGDKEGMVSLYTLAIRWSPNPEEKMQLCQECLPISEELQEGPVLARFLNQIANVYYSQGLEETASHYSQQALEMGKRLGDVEVQAATLVTIGGSSYLSHEGKLEILKQSVDLAEKHQLLDILETSLNNLGILYGLIFGKIREAYRYVKRSLELARFRGDLESELFLLGQLASLPIYLGDLEAGKKMLEHIQARLEALPDIDQVLAPGMNWRRAVFHRQKGEWDLALQAIQHSLSAHRHQGNFFRWRFTIIDIYIPILLDINRFLHQPVWIEAEENMREVLDLSEEEKVSNRLWGSVHAIMSVLCSRQGKLEQAAGWLETGLQLSEDNPGYLERKDLIKAEVELAIAHKEWDKAMEGYATYLALVEGAEQRWEVARTYLDWADIYVSRDELDDRDRAQELYRKSLDMFTEMGADGYVKVVKERLDDLGILGKINP
jgi:class 3 adenylate cyclase/tetratricopeptide (TPR) repeat protein